MDSIYFQGWGLNVLCLCFKIFVSKFLLWICICVFYIKNNSKYHCRVGYDLMLLAFNFKPGSSQPGLPNYIPSLTSSRPLCPWLPPLCPGGLCAATSCPSFRTKLEGSFLETFPAAPDSSMNRPPQLLWASPAPGTDLHGSTITPDSLYLLLAFPRDVKLLLKGTGCATGWSVQPNTRSGLPQMLHE